ncbi:MAG: hypothetical protein RR060_04990 [Victivallaceae bacterium]
MSIGEKESDDRIINMDLDAKERIRRISALQSQISLLAADERKVLMELSAAQKRHDQLQVKLDEIAQIEANNQKIEHEITQRSAKITELERRKKLLQEERSVIMARTATLRAQLTNESCATDQERRELEELQLNLAEKTAMKRQFIEDRATLDKLSSELIELESESNLIQERLPEIRKKYEYTRQLVAGLGGDFNPTAEAIREIWQKLPPDVMDERMTNTLF